MVEKMVIRIRNKRIAELYQLITHSDFAGNMEDDYPVRAMYAVLCLEKANREVKYDALTYVSLADDLLRAYDAKLYDVTIPMEELATALFSLELPPEKIRKMSSVDLRKKLEEAINEDA